MHRMRDYNLYDEVEIIATGEHAFIIWYDEIPEHDSIMLEIKGKNEFPKFYERKDFRVIRD